MLADSFLGKWIGRRAVPDPAVAEARAEVERIIAERPSLSGPALWLRDTLVQLAIPESVSTPALSPELALEKLVAGIPLLRGETVVVDAQAFHRRWRRACAALSRDQEDRAGQLVRAAERGQLDPQHLVSCILAGRPEQLHEQSVELGLDPSLAATLVRLTLFPVFVALKQECSRLYQIDSWQRGYCPICGSWPILGEFRGLDQLRYLRCGLCAAAWTVPRLFCPFCETRDYRQLNSFHRAGEECQRRVSCCSACHRYLKMLVTLNELPPLRLLVADLSTLDLDLAAADRGFCQ